MAITNLTGDRNHKTFEKLYCSAELTEGIHNQLICLSVLNIFLSFTAFLGNTLILVALHKESSLHPPSRLLYRSLATTDLGVGIIAEPLNVAFWLCVAGERCNICRYVKNANIITAYTLCSVSFFYIDCSERGQTPRPIAAAQIQTSCNFTANVSNCNRWAVSIAGSTMSFWNYLITLWYGYVGILLSLATFMFSYTKIFLTLRHHQKLVQEQVHQDQPSQTIPLNVARYRKALSSALWIQLTLVVCYMPHKIAGAWMTQRGLSPSVFIANEFAATLVYLNSSVNPFLYCWKIREVRQAVKETNRQYLRI